MRICADKTYNRRFKEKSHTQKQKQETKNPEDENIDYWTQVVWIGIPFETNPQQWSIQLTHTIISFVDVCTILNEVIHDIQAAIPRGKTQSSYYLFTKVSRFKKNRDSG